MGAASSRGREPWQRWCWPGAPRPRCLGNAFESGEEPWPVQGPGWVPSWRYLCPDPGSLLCSPAPRPASVRGKGRRGEALGKSDVSCLQLPWRLWQPEPREGRAAREPWHGQPVFLALRGDGRGPGALRGSDEGALGGSTPARLGWTRLEGQPGLCLLRCVTHAVGNSPAPFWGPGQGRGISALPTVLGATWVLPAACWRWAELPTRHREPWLHPQGPSSCRLPPPGHVLGSAGYHSLGDRVQEHSGSPQPHEGVGWPVPGWALPPESLGGPRSAQPGLPWLGAAGALRAPGLLRGVDVLTQCGLLQSRQALTKNTVPVRRELPRHTLLCCFP